MSSRRTLIAAVVSFFLLRFAAGVVTIRRGSFLVKGAREYHELARNLAAGVVGFLRLWKREPTSAAAFLVVVLSGASVHTLTFATIRHRVPFVDVTAVCLAPAVLLDWARGCLARWRKAFPAQEGRRVP